MNLYDMLRRNDDVLTAQPGTALLKYRDRATGETFRGLEVAPNDQPQITIREFARWYPFRSRPEKVGWYARCAGNASLDIRITHRGNTISEKRIDIGADLREIPIPWPFGTPIEDEADLTLHFDLSKWRAQKAGLIVHRALDRNDLYSRARGDGIEIGPGSRPQILNSPGVSVRYVEEMPPDKWRQLYDPDGKYRSDLADWSKYIVGTASDLPVEDDSIDFIFSSHVFEHLVNPIGHLERWSRKLRAGGVVLAIIPDLAGTKDYRHQPCSFEELISEHIQDIWEPQRRHYERWASTRGWTSRVDEAMAAHRSIHTHFYSRESLATLLEYVRSELPFTDFSIRHTPNHRDFYWLLTRK